MFKQLSAVINQGNRPIAFLHRKLTEMQQCYSMIEIELLAIVLLAIIETLKEFKGIMWGQRTKVYTDLKTLSKMPLG